MAKDPAFLFYYQDFLVGTAFMKHGEIGAYIVLLCHQADKGRLSLDQILHLISPEEWECLKGKFKEEDGLFYNERLGGEVMRRKDFCKSRRDNRVKGVNASKKLFLEYVYLLDSEVEKLNKTIGKHGMKDFIERLDGYLGASTKNQSKYSSHYHTILNWWRKDGKPISKKDIDERNEKEYNSKYGDETPGQVKDLVKGIAGEM